MNRARRNDVHCHAAFVITFLADADEGHEDSKSRNILSIVCLRAFVIRVFVRRDSGIVIIDAA